MSDGFFYSKVIKNKINEAILNELEKYAVNYSSQVYVIDSPLGERKYEYDYQESIVVLIPKHQIIFINFDNTRKPEFEDYFEDFVEDLGYLSDKYDYKKVLGRPRVWRKEYINKTTIENFMSSSIVDALRPFKLSTKVKERNVEFLISLLTGSINDVTRVGSTFPQTLLDKIKQKIVLFDGDQTKFIYEELNKDRITIQGLAGTGKTELLLHKLKDLYTNDSEAKIVFTCHNKILAENLKHRIPIFFDFMKVNEQIKWNERLWTINSWGSESNSNSGLYSYICDRYNLTFSRYSPVNTFDRVCKNALEELNKLESMEPCFDYILIDESQDFPESFFKLCEKITRNKVYIAGDIFQNVFEEVSISKVTPDFLLNKCYRTDPRTLMFAHAIAMGLFSKKLRWLTDEEWKLCGYLINKDKSKYKLSRKPLRRFEDLEQEGVDSLEIINANSDEYSNKIVEIISEIVKTNATVKPDDIGIVFLENCKDNYDLANKLMYLIDQKFGWNVNIGYESKAKHKNTLFISNRNNVKGLEFPFVICITQNKISNNLQRRNSIYMMLTRSFLKTYFLVNTNNGEYINQLKNGISSINKNNYLEVIEPSSKEKEELRNAIINNPSVRISQFELVENIMDEIGVKKEYRERLHSSVTALHPNEFDYSVLYETIDLNYKMIGNQRN